MKHFNPTPSTLEELKKMYRKLALANHPDCGGDVETMKEVNAEYDTLFVMLKNTHKNKDGKTYTKETDEAPSYFRELINALIKMNGVAIEVIGIFVWVSGNTKAHKEELKKLGFKWHSKKECWYKAPEGYRRSGNKEYSMNDIRDMYGVQYEGSGAEEEKKTYHDNKQYIA